MKETWWNIIFRHLTTIIVAVGVMWTVAKPHAEDFVRKTVNERLVRMENKLDQQEIMLSEIIRRLDIIDSRVKRR